MESILWVCRPGQKAVHENQFLENNRIYIAWEGYNYNFSIIKTREDARKLVTLEKGTLNRTSISNWAGMIWSFVHEMKIGDYVLIPGYKSHYYTLAKIVGDYVFSNTDNLKHSREIQIIYTKIPQTIFSQGIRYSLGAFRTIFKVREEIKVLNTIKKWNDQT